MNYRYYWNKIARYLIYTSILATFIFIIQSCKKSEKNNSRLLSWETLDIPISGRYDDVYFIDDRIGWAAGGSSGNIFKTIDGGHTWEKQFHTSKYLRSIEFINANLGFCGSIDSAFYKTIDGGKTWINIAGNIPGGIPGICGLTSVNSSIIYGCGIWSSPAFIIKSEDSGNTWKKIDMSFYANALIDMFFFDKDKGFAVGRSKNIGEGGVILYTKDGGEEWTVIYKTNFAKDYIWKIQTPDNIHFYASIDAQSGGGKTRMLKSNDKGSRWNTITISDQFYNTQSVGFIDPLTGWVGGKSYLFETTDGGNTWHEIQVGGEYNRFFRIDQNTAFLSGNKIYKYKRHK